MGGSQKAPPRLPKPPAPVPHATRVYGHVHGSFDVACPACHTINVVGMQKGRRRKGKGTRVRLDAVGYNPVRGTLICRGCLRSWYVGLLLWVVGRNGHRAEDHVPDREEGAQLRELYGSYAHLGPGLHGRPRVNRVCWCAQPGCPVHDEAEGEVTYG